MILEKKIITYNMWFKMIIDIDGDCVMEKIENEYFVINYSKSLNKIVKEMIRISTKKVPEIFDFFQIKNTPF